MKSKKQTRGVTRPTMSDLQGNATLRGLNPSDAGVVMREGELVHLRVRERIYNSEVEIEHAYFPLEAIISIVADMRDGTTIEVGTVGREGVSAIPLLMGAATTANASYCQVPGRAIKISVDVFRKLMTKAPAFRQLLDRYLQAYVNMLGQLAACNRLHSVYERCARWLLMSFDRVENHASTSPTSISR